MKTPHHPTHWVSIALVTAAALLTITEAAGQSTGAGAVFEGRPAMAGAQAGQGAMAGPPQGGIGLQGAEGSKLSLRRPAIVDQPVAGDMPQGAPAVTLANSNSADVRAADLAPAQRERDSGIAKQQRSPSDKVRRAAKRTVEGAKYGVSPIDTR